MSGSVVGFYVFVFVFVFHLIGVDLKRGIKSLALHPYFKASRTDVVPMP